MELHHTAVKEEKGFSLVEILLCLIIVCMVAFIGYYVYNTQKSVDNTYNSANKTAESALPKTIKKPTQASSADPTVNWLLYEAPEKQYTIRLADGWKLSRYQSNPSLNTFNNNDVKPVAGTKAVVTQIDGGRDGSSGLYIGYLTSTENLTIRGTKQASLKTTDGLEVEVYHFTQTGESTGMDISTGGQQYIYVIRKSPKQIFTLNYSFEASDADYHASVEAAAKTVHFN